MNMSLIDEAERRLHEVRLVSAATRTELKGMFNEAANAAGKYKAWVEYEILKAEKQLKLDRATVILDKAPIEAAKMKEQGIKMNEDIREALIARDEECSHSLEVLNALQAVKAILDSHFWSFIRAINSVDEIAQNRSVTPTPNFSSGSIGQTWNTPQTNLMGKNERE